MANPATQPLQTIKTTTPPPTPPPVEEHKLPELPRQLPGAEAISPQLVEQTNADLETGDIAVRKSAADRLGKIMQTNPDVLDTSKPYASRQYRPYVEALILKAL